MFRQTVLILMVGVLVAAIPARAGQDKPAPSHRPPDEIAFDRLTADAVIPLALERGAVASDDAVWMPATAAGTVTRVDAKDNATGSPISAGSESCASLAVAFDSVWVPLCGDGTIARVDLKELKATATAAVKVAADGRIASGVGSVWAITDRAKGVVSRIDPDTNMVIAEIYVATGVASIALEDDALWITSEHGSRLTRVNPHNNQVVEPIEVGPRPGPIAVGEGAVWTLNRGDGTVTRVDPDTNKVVATIKVGDDVALGELAAGEGSVWISAPGVPLIRIDPRTNRAVQRFTGEGGGAVIVAHGSVWVAAGPRATKRIDPLLAAALRP